MEHKRAIEERMERKVKGYFKKGFKIFFMVLFGIGLFLLANYVLMWLWNWLMPDLFGLPTISYWQALGLLVLAKIIFGFGGGSSSSKSKSRSKRKFKSSGKCGSLKRDFDEWKLYDQFWKEEGEEAYKNFVGKKQENEKSDSETKEP